MYVAYDIYFFLCNSCNSFPFSLLIIIRNVDVSQ